MITNNIQNEIIDFVPNKEFSKLKPKRSGFSRKAKELLKKALFFKINRDIKKRNLKFLEFRKKKLRISAITYQGDEEIKKNKPIYDKYIVGSDQVWNTDLSNDSKTFYLDFVKKEKKIAYAASFGQEFLKANEREYIKKYLRTFDFLSLREELHQKMLLKMFNLKAEFVLDPVFLLDKSKWQKLINPLNLPKRYLVVYILEYSQELIKHAKQMAKKKECKVIYIPFVAGDSLRHNVYTNLGLDSLKGSIYNNLGPTEFLAVLANAEYICTNSFHGLAFSIIFEKNFTVCKHPFRNLRIDNLLKVLDLKSRYLDCKSNKCVKIDYKSVEKRLNPWLIKSKKFLATAIKENN